MRTHPSTIVLPLLVVALAAGCDRRPGAGGSPPSIPAPEARAGAPAAPPAAAPDWRNDWIRGAVFYEVFVRSFRDSDGDGIGDLGGLVSKLDYLNDGDPSTTTDLGVDALWLMPVFRSPSYHGYDVTDYETINPPYGTNDDFALLVSEAHRRGIRILLDLVVNHTGAGHPWFVTSASSPSSPKRDWYVWRPDDPGWTQPWGGSRPTWHERGGAYYYGIFWSGMPDLNLRNPAVRAEVERVAALWLGRGVDGFRLDAARHLIETGPGQGQCDSPETHAFWKEFSAAVRRVKPEAVLVGENWSDTPIIASYYGSTARVAEGDELPMNFDFPLAERIVAGVREGSAAGIAAKIAEVKAGYPPGVEDAPFLTNHDMVRLATQLGGDRARTGLAAAILLTLPGSPFLYYGEEVGLQNGPTDGDESKRTPMPWDASQGGGFTDGTPWFPFAPGRETSSVVAQSGDPASLLSRYRRLIAVRKGSDALRLGGIDLLAAEGTAPPVLAFVRAHGAERVLVAHNLADRPAEGGSFAVRAAVAEALFVDPGATASPAAGAPGWRVSLPPRATGIWRLR